MYKGPNFGSAAKIGVYDLDGALGYISVPGNTQTGDNYFIVLGENNTAAPKTLGYSGKTVGITLMADGAERIVQLGSNGSLFTVNNGVTLTLENNVTLKGRAGNTGSLVRIDSSGVFTMNGGEISGNTLSSQYRSGGGVYIYDGTFTMSGGKISGNTSSSSGGGVEVGGTFTMNGGEISGNTSSYGGGVDNGGTFTMSGGTISGNTASSSGGGVYNNGTFTMNAGAIINGNTASGSGGGGGVCNYGTFTMNNGTISGNTASSFPIIKSFGGGVYTNGTFTMGNGTISENTASVYRATGLGGSLYESFGGGVYAGNSTFTMSGGEISGNSTSSYGGGVYVLGSMFTKSSTGGLITGYGNNTVNGNKVVTNGVVQSGQGHAVYVVGNPAKKQENTVPANKALDSRVDGAAGGWTE